jgi:hypothetical protein
VLIRRGIAKGTVVARIAAFSIRSQFAPIIGGMSRKADFDYQREAEAAMKMAAATSGYERLNWVRVAWWWQALGRDKVEQIGSDTRSLKGT